MCILYFMYVHIYVYNGVYIYMYILMVYIIASVPCSNVVYGVWSSIPQMESLYWVLYMPSIMLGKCITAKTGVNHYGLVYHYLGQQIIMLSFPLYTCTLKCFCQPLLILKGQQQYQYLKFWHGLVISAPSPGFSLHGIHVGLPCWRIFDKKKTVWLVKFYGF